MGAAVFALSASFLFILGSTVIQETWLAVAQFIAGLWFAFAGAVQGWQSTRD
jgi:hypothetical protein